MSGSRSREGEVTCLRSCGKAMEREMAEKKEGGDSIDDIGYIIRLN